MTGTSGQNLAIQLTAPGTAALAVVRVQGPDAARFVAQHFDRPARAGRCVYGRWRDEAGAVLDDGILVADGAGAFDLNLHGGRRIVARVLEQATAAGFRAVTGESAIAAAAGDDDIAAWLPRATTMAGVRMLLAQPAAWRALDPATLDLESLLADHTLRRLLTPATVAIVGAPNVGKSTLANALLGRERSIVADQPGTTRDWVEEYADLAGLPVIFVDTPGRRESADAIEREAIALSHAPVESADLVVLVIDAARPADVPPGFESALRVANKCDLAAAPPGWLPVSARTGAGLPALIETIHRGLGVDVTNAHRANCWTNAQISLLRGGGAQKVHTIAHHLQSLQDDQSDPARPHAG